MFKRHKRWIALIAVSLWIGWGFIPFPADAGWSRFGAWDTITKLLGVAHTWTADQTFDSGAHLILPQVDEVATPALAWGDGDTGIYEVAANQLAISISGTRRWLILGDTFQSSLTSGGGLLNEATTSINPTNVPNRGDTDTGIGSAAADQVSLVAGGVEGARITEAQRTIETDATVCETDGGDLRVVTVATHALSVDDITQYADGTGGVCTNIVAATNYYVTQVDDANKFNIATSRGGTNILFSTAGTAFSSFEQEITINSYGPIVLPRGLAAQPSLTITDKDGSTDNGFYTHLTTANDVRVSVGGVGIYNFGSTAMGSTQATGGQIKNATASATTPGFQFGGDSNTGIGTAGADNLSFIVGGAEAMRIIENDTGDISITVLGTAPGLGSCGTSPSVTGSDTAGKITIGTGATTSCTVTFTNAFATNAPACVIAGDNSAITYAATTSTTVLTITSSGDMASDVISYICLGIL